MVIPRSRSMSIESRYCSRICRGSTAPVSSRMRSDRVDLPWSTWLMMEKFRIRSTESTGRPAYPSRPRRRSHGSRGSAGRGMPIPPPGRRWEGPGANCYPGTFPVVGPESGRRDPISRLAVVAARPPPPNTTRTPRTRSGKHQEPDQAQPPDHQAPGPQQGRPFRAEDADQAGRQRPRGRHRGRRGGVAPGHQAGRQGRRQGGHPQEPGGQPQVPADEAGSSPPPKLNLPPPRFRRLGDHLATGDRHGRMALHYNSRHALLDPEWVATLPQRTTLLPERALQGGSYGLVALFIEFMTVAANNPDCSYVVFLSGQDYPIVPLGALEERLGQFDVWMSATPVDEEPI